MAVACKYDNERVLDISYEQLSQTTVIDTNNKYNLLLIEKGSLRALIEGRRYSFMSPCIIARKENEEFKIISSPLLQGQVLSFNVSFLNVNITYDLINSGSYEKCAEQYGFIPLNVFYESTPEFFGSIPLNTDSTAQLKELFTKFNTAIAEQTDMRWSCRARLWLNCILEQIQQLYQSYINKDTTVYDIKDPNTWVSMLLEKIHNDYREQISLKTMAEFIHINKTTVAKEFKAITGFSVTDYIINYRIKCACYSLATTEITLRELAMDCGFKSESYFIRQFSAKRGMTPSEYRKTIVKKRKKEL